jgi:hypothetical protein
MDDGVRYLLMRFAEGFGETEVRVQSAVDLAIVREVDLEGVNLCIEWWGKRGKVEVQDRVISGEEMGDEELARFAGAAGYDDPFGHGVEGRKGGAESQGSR